VSLATPAPDFRAPALELVGSLAQTGPPAQERLSASFPDDSLGSSSPSACLPEPSMLQPCDRLPRVVWITPACPSTRRSVRANSALPLVPARPLSRPCATYSSDRRFRLFTAVLRWLPADTCFGAPATALPSKFPAAPGYCYSDRLSFPGFRLSVTSRKSRPFSFLTDVLPSGFRNVRCPSSGIAPFRSFGGRSALVTFVRVALLLPSDDETVRAFTFCRLRKVFGRRSFLFISPPSGPTFQ
jgi:hypothetical protein